MSVINLNSIKSSIKSTLFSANTTTASTDLSSGLSIRVQKILSVNPSMIPIQATYYPYVTVFVDSKSMDEATIARDQQTGKRKATIDLKIVGAVWNSTISDPALDDADDDCESLMENVEEILRTLPTLGGYVKWSYPIGTTYHNIKLAEHSSLRAGMMTVRATAFY